MRRIASMTVINDLLTEAERVANRLGESVVAPEHVLVAAAGHPDGAAAAVLAASGVDAGMVEAAVVGVHDDALASMGIDAGAAAPTTPSSRTFRGTDAVGEFLLAVQKQAKAYDADVLSSAHVLITATLVERGTIARALDRLGLDRDDLRRAAVAELGARTR
jgi:ATP-dependent Clp protease ATP-binding subunit ClpA